MTFVEVEHPHDGTGGCVGGLPTEAPSSQLSSMNLNVDD
jgi:hypothetical protein